MTPETLLGYHDRAELWPEAPSAASGFDMAAAYQSALAVRRLRMARGEAPSGYKIGFTNRSIWQRYQVFAPIWGTVYNTSLRHCDGHGVLNLAGTCQPRIEPETVFGIKATPAPDTTLEQLFEALDWVAPGFEVVHSHMADWKFKPPDTVADGGLHARLLVGRRRPIHSVAASAAELHAALAAAEVVLSKGAAEVERGRGAHVLDSPLHALQHFLTELRQCPGAPDLAPGDVVTTGTWTDAWPIKAGERWSAAFSAPLGRLAVEFQ